MAMRLVGLSDPVPYRLIGRVTRAPESADFYTASNEVVVRWHVTVDGGPRQVDIKSLVGVVPIGFEIRDFVGTRDGLCLVATDGHQVRILHLQTQAGSSRLLQTSSWVMLFEDRYQHVENLWAVYQNGEVHVFFETTTTNNSSIYLAKHNERNQRPVTLELLRSRQDGLADRLLLLDRPAVLGTDVAYGFVEERDGIVTISMCVDGPHRSIRRVWRGQTADFLTASCGALGPDCVFLSVEGADTFAVFKAKGNTLQDAGVVPIPDTCVRTRAVALDRGRAILISEDLTTQTLMTVVDTSSDTIVVQQQDTINKDYGIVNRVVNLDHNVALLLDAEPNHSRIAVLSERLNLRQRAARTLPRGRYPVRRRSIAR